MTKIAHRIELYWQVLRLARAQIAADDPLDTALLRDFDQVLRSKIIAGESDAGVIATHIMRTLRTKKAEARLFENILNKTMEHG